ncbi:MAG: lyase family protein [Phycisphaerales bacterium]|jgi:adenylosuccinate lyase
MTSPYDTYVSPLASRNASQEMLRLWSQRHKFNTWRRIWLAVAEAQHEVGRGLPDGAPRASGGVAGVLVDPPASAGGSTGARGSKELVTKEQVEELRAVVARGITDDEIRLAEKYERDLRHDVMAHVHALGDACPKAKGIIHLGMTSQDVVCNADLSILDEAIHHLMVKVTRLVTSLGSSAESTKAIPALGFTHYQPAQPVTVGRRIAGWASDMNLCRERVEDMQTKLSQRQKGLRGATGTQASYLALCNNESATVDLLEASAVYARIELQSPTEAMSSRSSEGVLNADVKHYQQWFKRWSATGDLEAAEESQTRAAELSALSPSDRRAYFANKVRAAHTFPLTGQTYPRVIDTFILADLASVASVLHKIATDIRLLSNRKELDEPFEDKQIGSSAMPYKRNPMRCERICGLARFVMNLVGNAYDTAATQWLERTLDDSSNRRLSLPEAFLALDGALDLMHNVASGLIVHEAMVRKNLMAELSFMATENIMMACVKLGGDRQHYHELIRVHAQAAGLRVKSEGLDNDLLDRLRADQNFWSKARGGPLAAELDWEGLLDPMKYVGRSVEQTERFIKDVVDPLRAQYADAIAKLDQSGPRV